MNNERQNGFMGKMECEDIEYIINTDTNLRGFDDSTVFITGATGFIGSHLIKLFLKYNLKYEKRVRIVAMVRNMSKARMLFGDKAFSENLEFVIGDVTESIKYVGKVDYIFHFASITASRIMVEHPVRTIDISYSGTKNILHFAVEKKCKGVIYASSMEVYGIPEKSLEYVTEKDLGYIDLMNPRSSYSEGKRICECLCTAFHKEYGVPVKIARLAQSFGAGVLEGDRRVYVQFAESVIKNDDIILHTDGQSEGNYCYIRDVLTGLLCIALKGEAGTAYNIVNETCHMKICDMAEMVAKNIARGNIKVVYEIPEDLSSLGYAPKIRMKMSGRKLNALGWNAEVGLEEAYKRMIKDMENHNYD